MEQKGTQLSTNQKQLRKDLRQQYRSARRSLTELKKQQATLEITRRVCRSREFIRARRIACYFASDAEVDTTLLMQTAWDRNKSIATPIIDFRDNMHFVEYQRDDKLTTGKWGLLQPAAGNIVPASTFDLIIMPLVAFDNAGNRLGRGGGYYDRYLGQGYRQLKLRKSFLLGLAYDCQRADNIPSASWDIPLHAVATESGMTQMS